MTIVINGLNGGNDPLILGQTGGDDIINAFDYNNAIFSEGANDQIFAGVGSALVNLNGTAAQLTGVTDSVTLNGTNDTVTTGTSGGHTSSTLTVMGGTGGNVTTLANASGINNVSLQGYLNNITVNSDATNILVSGSGRGRVTAGAAGDGNYGFTTFLVDAGQSNTVIGGDQNLTTSGGQGYDTLTLGNGNHSITEAGTKDQMTIGTGSVPIGYGNNTINDFGGAASITFNGFVANVPFVTSPPYTAETINLGITNNTVTEMQAGLHSAANFTIKVSGGGTDTFTLGDGDNYVSDNGSHLTVNEGTPVNNANPAAALPGGVWGDVVTGIGTFDSVTLGNGANLVTTGGNSDTITLGPTGFGANKVVAGGDGDTIVVGNGANNITSDGSKDNITMGIGKNTLHANGNQDTIVAGKGDNHIIATGNQDTITLGAGDNTVTATGNNDTITSAGGLGTFAIGSQDNLKLTGSSALTTVDSQGANNTIVLNSNANATIADDLSGGYMTVTENGPSSGTVVVNGLENDLNFQINLLSFGFTGVTTDLHPLTSHAAPDGLGGTMLNLPGGGTMDLVAVQITPAHFTAT